MAGFRPVGDADATTAAGRLAVGDTEAAGSGIRPAREADSVTAGAKPAREAEVALAAPATDSGSTAAACGWSLARPLWFAGLPPLAAKTGCRGDAVPAAKGVDRAPPPSVADLPEVICTLPVGPTSWPSAALCAAWPVGIADGKAVTGGTAAIGTLSVGGGLAAGIGWATGGADKSLTASSAGRP